jgi:N-terminal domain of anti-restriction factor ArdC
MAYTHRSRTPASQADRRAQDQALKDSITQGAAALVEEVKQGRSERFEQVLQFAARFHQYSLGNQLLIAEQCPSASRVAGYKTWERMGYHVAQGQHGIRILAPRPYVKHADEQETEDGATARMGLYFVSCAVFDASQLNADEVAAKPLPQFFTALDSDDQTDALAARVVDAMQAHGIRVTECGDLPGSVQGYSEGGHVALRAGLPSRNRLQTLCHEWAHELLHQGTNAAAKDASRGVRECHAEATAYIVCAHYGLHNPFSADYLQSWSNTPETLMAELGWVQQAATTIITALGGEPHEPATVE